MKKAVITVIGYDKVGIIYSVTKKLMEHDLNILEISQTILDHYFAMIMTIDISKLDIEFEALTKEFDELAHEVGVDIRVQHQDIFDSMHRI